LYVSGLTLHLSHLSIIPSLSVSVTVDFGIICSVVGGFGGVGSGIVGIVGGGIIWVVVEEDPCKYSYSSGSKKKKWFKKLSL